MSTPADTPTLARLLLAELERDPAARDELRQALAVHEPDPDERLLTPREAADRIGVHPDTLTRAAKDGRVPGATQDAAGGRAWRFRPSELRLLPPARPDLGLTPAARAVRHPARDSSATQAILGDQAA